MSLIRPRSQQTSRTEPSRTARAPSTRHSSASQPPQGSTESLIDNTYKIVFFFSKRTTINVRSLLIRTSFVGERSALSGAGSDRILDKPPGRLVLVARRRSQRISYYREYMAANVCLHTNSNGSVV